MTDGKDLSKDSLVSKEHTKLELVRGIEPPTGGLQNLNERTSASPGTPHETASFLDYWLE